VGQEILEVLEILVTPDKVAMALPVTLEALVAVVVMETPAQQVMRVALETLVLPALV
tara:strand:+ start:320 stop:490 length:171 start_codon:yes stop_codon:yes gene_type:complete